MESKFFIWRWLGSSRSEWQCRRLERLGMDAYIYIGIALPVKPNTIKIKDTTTSPSGTTTSGAITDSSEEMIRSPKPKRTRIQLIFNCIAPFR